MWTPIPTTKYGIVVCSFDGKQAKHGLPLTIGDTVQIFEECQGWYRGCLTHKKVIKGIFPKAHVHLKECTADVQGPNATVTPLEDTVAREVSYILREWVVLWKQLYLAGEEDLFSTMHNVMIDLAQLRRELLTHTLSKDQVLDIKASIVSKIDWGNKRLSLDLVPRIQHEPVDVDSISPVQLYRLHEESVRAYTGANSRGSIIKRAVSSGNKWKTSNHHLLLNFKHFGCSVGEETELHFTLYDATNSVFFSERFVSRMTKNGLPVNIDKLHNNIALFTDLGGTDLLRDAYLVVHIYKYTSLRDMEPSKKSKAAVYKRPYGCATLAINSILIGSGEFESELTLKICQVSSESEFPQLHDNIIRKSSTKFTLPSTAVQTGLVVGLKIVHGSLESVTKEDPVLFRHVIITRKIGFADMIMPGDVRNDLYLTLASGVFEKGNKSAGKNIEVKVGVYDSTGVPLKNCVSPGSGEDMQTCYTSVIFYHNNHPHWNDTIKLDVPMEFYLTQGSHIRLEFRHCSTRDRGEQKLFGFSFVPLVVENGTTLKDGAHELFVYKVEDVKKLTDPSKYITLPSTTAEIRPEIGNVQGNPFFRRSDKEFVEIKTLLCSTKLTQNADLLAVLRWQENRDNLSNILHRLMNLNGHEIITYLQDILDALFTMFRENGGLRISESHILFKALCHILLLVEETKFEHFKPVIDSYIKNHFSAVLACRDLLLCLKETIETAASRDDQSYNEECLKVVEYVVKFIVQGRKLFARATVHSPTESVFHEFETLSSELFEAMRSLLTIPYDAILSSQIMLLHNIPKVFTVYKDVLPGLLLCETFSQIIKCIPSEMADKVHRKKMKCLRDIVNSPLFDDQECKNVLIPLCAEELNYYIKQQREIKQCAEILGDILIRLHDDYAKSDKRDIRNVKVLLVTLLDPVVCRLLDDQHNVTILSHLVASVIGLLRLLELDKALYQSLVENYLDLDERRNLLIRLLRLFARLVQDDVYPVDWMVMRMSLNQVILSTLQFISQTLLEDYHASAIVFESELWETYFVLAVSFLTQSCLQIEKFSEAKRHKIKERYGDMRVRMGYEILAMWESLGIHKLHFVPSLVGPFLEVTLIPETELRMATLPIFFDMMECERKAYNSFRQVESELIDKLDILINEHKGDDEYKQLFKSILLEKVKSESEWSEIGSCFVESVTHLLENLLDYRNVLEGDDNRDKRMTCTVNLLHFYKDEIKRQEMYIRYIHKLTQLHLESINYTEAAFTLQLHAQLLDWSERECDETKDFPAEKEWQRKEVLYLRIIAYFDTGKTWEYAIPLCEELAQFYKSKILYKKLSNILQVEATYYDKILTEMRPEAEYFRVGFYGQGFPLFLRNKEFIYRGNELERLGSFTQRILCEHSDAAVLNCNTALTDSLHIEHGKYIQISPVRPVAETDPVFTHPDVPQSVQNFHKVNEISTFQLDRPFHRGDKDESNEFKTLCIKRTVMKTVSKLPGILRWFEVTDTTTHTLTPVEVAIDAVTKKTDQIRSLTAEYMSSEPANLHPLTMLLNGTIDAAVQGGLQKYEEAFFGDDFLKTYPYHQPHVAQLKARFIDQIQILDQSLHLHGRLMCSEVRPLHARLMQLFTSMKTGIKQSGSPSLARLISVTESLTKSSQRGSSDSSISMSPLVTPTDSNRSSGVYTGESTVPSSENISNNENNSTVATPPRPPSEPPLGSSRSISSAVSSVSLDSAVQNRTGQCDPDRPTSRAKHFDTSRGINNTSRDVNKDTPRARHDIPPPPPPRRRLQSNTSNTSDSDILNKDSSPSKHTPPKAPRRNLPGKVSIPSATSPGSDTSPNDVFLQKVPSPKTNRDMPFPPLSPFAAKNTSSTLPRGSFVSYLPQHSEDSSGSSTCVSEGSSVQSVCSKSTLKTSVSDGGIVSSRKGPNLHKAVSFSHTGANAPPPIPEKKRTHSEKTKSGIEFGVVGSTMRPEVNTPPPVPCRTERSILSPTARKPPKHLPSVSDNTQL